MGMVVVACMAAWVDAVPYVATMILNYKHKKFAVTNSWSFNSGASYGSPTQWPGYFPTSCIKAPVAWSAAHGGISSAEEAMARKAAADA